MPASEQLEDASQLLRAEYVESQSLLLTPGEAAELLDIDRATALTALQALETSGFLELTPDGRFRMRAVNRDGS